MRNTRALLGAAVLVCALYPVRRADAQSKSPDAPSVPAESVDEEPQFDRPAAGNLGVLAGTVTDAKDGEGILDAKVSVVGTKVSTLTDIDGHYRLEVPPGSYQLKVYVELHRPARFEGVRASKGQVTKLDATLELEKGVEDVIEVEARADTTSVEGQILSRKRSAAVGDSVGRKEMQKAPDKTAAEAAKRVVGATIEGGRFVYVRGLGERYTNASLDGATLPSPEPDKNVVPLDLFPTQILDGVTLVKTFTPDVPGDFAGGSVRITTRRYTQAWTLGASMSLGLNTQSSFARGLGYDGSNTDWLGFDSSRHLPSDFPGWRASRTGKKPDGTFPTPDELTRLGRSINAPMRATERVIPPNFGGALVASKGWKVGKESEVGFLAALVYDRKFETRNDEILRTFYPNPQKPSGILPYDAGRVDRGIDKVNWGLLAGLTYQIDKSNRLYLTGLFTRSADKEASRFRMSQDGQGLTEDTRLSFIARGLMYGQLRGEHDFAALGNARLEYAVTLARANRDEPDRRGLVYGFSSDTGWSYADDAENGLHFYSKQGETSVGGSVDWTQPLARALDATRLKFGGSVSVKSRAFRARRIRLKAISKQAPDALLCPGSAASGPDGGCVDRFLSDANIGRTTQIDEVGKLGDQYSAHLNVFAGYLMLDAQMGEHWRVIVGPRLEASFQGLDAVAPFDLTQERKGSLDEARILPAASIVYSPIESVNIRASVTRTVARPQLREIAPFTFSDYFGGRETSGNPDLLNTSIVNADIRFEFFPTLSEVVAVSAFFKKFTNPIEAVVSPSGDNGLVTYQNAAGARLFGMEFEARKSLGMFAKVLTPISIVANLAVAHSRIEIDPASAALLTNPVRPMAYQAPYVANVALDFSEERIGTDARLSYNVVGKRIAEVGLNGLPDVFQQPRHQLDFAMSQRVQKHVEVRGAITNLIDSPVELTQGASENGAKPADDKRSNVTSFYRTGRIFSLGVALSY